MRKLALVVLAVAACGGGDTAGPDARAVDGSTDPSVVETRSVRIGPLAIPPGQEQTVCVVVDLGNEVPRMLRSIRTALTGGTHHVIITRSTRAPAPTPTSCGPFSGGGGHEVLFIAQQSEGAITYPAGSGLPIAAHQSIHIEMHYINTQSEGVLMIGGEAWLELAAEAAGLRPIEFQFTGSMSLDLPPHSTRTVTSFHSLLPGTELFATTAHTHRWGRRATIELMASTTDPDPRLLHDSTDWAERPIDTFEPIVVVAGQGLRLTCNFENQSDQDVGFGLGAHDEMCFLWSHFVAAP